MLSRLTPRPVLVDVGASAGPPAVWRRIASASTYIGFDPDDRDLPQQIRDDYFHAAIVNRAVTASGDQDAAFYFTRSPYCSSMLRPNRQSLGQYTFASMFDVVSEGSVRTISLEQAIAQHALHGIDWLKLDTQGADLRIFQSLQPQHRASVLALDVEPGLIDAYEGEDLFIDVHRELTRQGFWLSRMDVLGSVRMRPETLEQLSRAGITAHPDAIAVRTSPGWCEARYFRTVDAVQSAGLARREHLLLAAFAILDEQWGFALETVLATERSFGADPLSTELKDECTRRLRRTPPSRVTAFARRVVPRSAREYVRRLIKA